jgi:hypothetical protein
VAGGAGAPKIDARGAPINFVELRHQRPARGCLWLNLHALSSELLPHVSPDAGSPTLAQLHRFTRQVGLSLQDPATERPLVELEQGL